MKKFLAILLSLITAFSALSIMVSAADDDLKIIVANDLHLSEKAYTPYTGNTANNAYAHVPSSGQLIYESNAIITQFLEDAAKSDCDFVILPGDLTNAGTQAEHLLLAAKFAEFENTTDKQIFVISGNHDMLKTNSDEFKLYYYQFGYDKALEVDTDSASYTAELNDEYRLLAIDSNKDYSSVSNLTDERLAWIEAQCKQAAADGKKLIAIMHHNLLEHFILSKKINKYGVVNNNEALAEILASYSVQYIFTAHTHDQDITTYTASNGKVIYDVVTNTLNGYPCQYRYVTFGEDIIFEEKTVTKIDTSLLPSGLSAEAVALAGENFREYTKACMWYGLRITFTNTFTPATLKKELNLNEEENAEFAAVFDKVSTKLCEAIKLPLYKADETESGKSIESIANANGDTLKSSNYTDVIDIIITLYQAHCLGDENYPIYSDEFNILITAVSAILNYALADLTAEEYTTAITFVCNMFDIEIPSWLMTFAGSGLSNVQGVDMFVSSVLSPLLVKYTVDDAPADNNVTLPGYGKTTISSEEGFFAKIRSFFQKIIDFFKSILAYFGNLA